MQVAVLWARTDSAFTLLLEILQSVGNTLEAITHEVLG